MYIPKRKQYGAYKVNKCPFCDKQATTKNSQQIPVCETHRKTQLQNLKCACGDYLDLRSGKYGIFFTCMNCGNINMRKAFDMNNL